MYLVICTVPELSVNLTLLNAVRSLGFDGPVALTAQTDRDAQALKDRDNVMVLRPLREAAGRVLTRLLITEGSDRPSATS